MSEKLKALGLLVAGVAVSWFMVGNFVFAIRHPWATSTERLICIKEVLLFQSVEYRAMRPRD